MLRYLKAMLIFAKYQARPVGVAWMKEDAAGLKNYLVTPSGAKFSAYMGDLVLRQQAEALVSNGDLQRAAGFCNGQKALIATVESLANADIFPSERDDTDSDSNQ
jgi:hypothetical protein